MSVNVDDIAPVVRIPTNITLESLVDFAEAIGCEVDIRLTMKSKKEEDGGS